MRGEDRKSGGLFSYIDLEARVPAKHPLRIIRSIVNDVLAGLSSAFAAQAKTKFRGVDRVRSQFTLALAAYNLIRLPRLLAAVPTGRP